MGEVIYLRLNLVYKDGTVNELRSAIPQYAADNIAKKGLFQVQVFIDRKIQYMVADNMNFDTIKTSEGSGK